MKRITLALFGLATALAMTPSASANTFSYFLFNADHSTTLDATFTASDAGGGLYEITGVTGTYTDTNNGIVADTIAALTPNPSFPSLSLTSDFLFLFDNLLNPDTSAFSGGVLDDFGVVFTLASGVEVNIASAGGNYYFASESPDGITVNNPQLITAVPEPSTLLLLGTGLLGLGVLTGRKLLA